MQSLENTMLITDLDGTLLPASKEISVADAAAISQFRAKGGKFAIATGRTLQAAQRYLKKLQPNIPVILFNGAAIYDPVAEKWLYTEELPSSRSDHPTSVRSISGRFGGNSPHRRHLCFQNDTL